MELESEKLTKQYLTRFHPYNSFEKFKTNGTRLSSNSRKVFLLKYNKTVVLRKFIFTQKYTSSDFTNDIKQYRKVELCESILKFFAIVKQNVNEVIFIHEYAYDGTLRQYLKQTFSKINWNDKLRLAKQLISAVKCLHDIDLIHLNLNSEKVFVHKGDIKIYVLQHQNIFNKFKYIQYIDPQYLQNFETYKLNKSSDVFSIGVLLWEISSGNIPFKSESAYSFNLLNAIIHGKREDTFVGTPKEYIKIYTECWQHDSNQRPTIQQVLNAINNIKYKNIINKEEIFEECDKKMTNKGKLLSDKLLSDLNTTDLFKHYNNLYDKTAKELELISLLITSLKKYLNDDNSVNNQNNLNKEDLFNQNNLCEDSTPINQDDLIEDGLFNNQNNLLNLISSLQSSLVDISEQTEDNKEQKFLYNLNQFFITQFNIQGGAMKDTISSIVYCLKKYIDDNNQNPEEILQEYYNYKYRSYFMSIIGFFHEYGIGTTINYHKAYDMYKKASEDYYYIVMDSSDNLLTKSLLKENQFIGLISLGLLYIDGRGVTVNQQEALKLFLKSVSKGSSLGKYYVGYCYFHGLGVIKNVSYSFDWFLESAKEGNAKAQNNVGYCYEFGEGISKDNDKALHWYIKSAEHGNFQAYNNIGYCYQNGIGILINKSLAFEWYLKSAEGGDSLGQNNLGYCYQYGIGTSVNKNKAFEWYLKSAENGNNLGQNNLGYCYLHGTGTSINENKAFEWYLKSAEGGNNSAQNNVGGCYFNSIGVPADEKKAFEWYFKSAEGGNTIGYNNLGCCYRDGIGTLINEKLAFECFMKSAIGGDSLGQNNLGHCFQYGIGTSIDEREACKWYSKSAEGGNILGEENLTYMHNLGISYSYWYWN